MPFAHFGRGHFDHILLSMTEASSNGHGRLDTVSDIHQAKKKRVHLNCRECRRTKTRCDRQWPCSSCVVKGLGSSCPNGILQTGASSKATIQRLEARVYELESRLQSATGTGGGEDTFTVGTRENPRPHLSSRLQADHPPAGALESAAILTGLVMSPHVSQQSRPVGADATAFYMSSPESSDGQGEATSSRHTVQQPVLMGVRPVSYRDAGFNVPWGRDEGVNIAGKGNMPGDLLDRCRQILPDRHHAIQLFEAYWAATSWR